MSDLTVYRLILTITAAASFAAAGWIFRLRPAATIRAEALPRNRMLGGPLGIFALLCCVPHAEPIVFGWMLPLLYPAAVAGGVLAFFYLDYLFSRAFAGIMILGAYSVVHGAWEFHAPLAAYLSIAAWVWGGAGIAFSGKPCWMRDVIRRCCASALWRGGWGGALAANGVLMLAGAVAQ